MAADLKSKVTVVLPVFNGEKYIRYAMESVLQQDYTNFELLIINDGSTDKTSDIISGFKDPRLKIISHEKNLGLVNSLNEGIDLSDGDYIVRMDADDICLPGRISSQVKFMEKNPSIGASGTFYFALINGKKLFYSFPTPVNETKAMLLFNSPVAHPTAIIRRSLLRRHNLKYSSQFVHAEDYFLWSQISEHADLSNLNKYFLEYRFHDSQVTAVQASSQIKSKSVDEVRTYHLNKLGIIPSDEETLVHRQISNGEVPESFPFVVYEVWLTNLRNANSTFKIYDPDAFDIVINERWLRLCVNAHGIKQGLSVFFKSDLFRKSKFNFRYISALMNSAFKAWNRKRKLR
jgi:glycosyltransferase involved in cell wall biosynthesis